MNAQPLLALDWQRFSLMQSALIEASAGTGKTHTLVLLVLRALLEQDLRLNDILLCTFTVAATAELSARVQARINQLAAWHAQFLVRPDPPDLAQGDGELWSYLAERWASDAIQQSDAKRIRLAQSDALSFSAKTLHGFCAEILQRFPIECQALTGLSSVDELALLERALSEELQVLSASARHVDAPSWQQNLELNQKSLAKLLSSLQRAFNYSELTVVAMPMPAAPCLLPELHQLKMRTALIEHIKQALQTPAHALRDAAKRLLVTLQNWLMALTIDADESSANWRMAYQICDGPDLKKVTAEGSQTTRAKLALAPEIKNSFSIFTWHADLIIAHESALFSHLLSAVRARMQRAMSASQLMTFEHIIEQVKRAVVANPGMAKPERKRTEKLVSALRAAYPLAFVDEFQDTNASQFAVLDAIFKPPMIGANASNTAATLIVIGDPKQAIYRFRGGDVYNYLRTAERLPRYVLSTNYRAQGSLVDALNAFYLPIASAAFATDGIAFYPVQKAQPNDANIPVAMTLAIINTSEPGKPSSSRDIWGKHCIDACALQVQNLLAGGVLACDIAVLLPRRSDIAKALNTLESLGIAAQVSARSDVVAGEPAKALMRLLRCIEAPADRKLQRAIWLASPFQLSATALSGAEELALARWFAPLPALLSQQGILAITNALFLACANLAPAEQARWQIDLRHLGELLAQSCAMQTHCTALIASLAALLVNESTEIAPDPHAGKQRGTAQNAVNLMTLHGAKGLEFPHVLLPLLWSAKRRSSSDYPLCANATGMQIDLGSAQYAQARAQENQEQLAELLRLQYVAITRAAKSVWIAIAAPALAEPAQNALHYSLALLGEVESQLVSEAKEIGRPSWELGIALLARSAAIHQQFIDAATLAERLRSSVRGLSKPQVETSEQSPAEMPAGPSIYPARRIQRRLSYSAITKMSAAQLPNLALDLGFDLASATAEPSLLSSVTDPELLDLAPIRGRSFGLIAHNLFENLWPFDAARWFSRLNARILELARSDPEMAQLMADPQRLSALQSMFERTANAPLRPAPGSSSLANLDIANLIVELEFHLPMPQLKLAQLAALGPKFGLPALLDIATPEPLSGMLQGFIDLVFFDQGRYYVLDYKTNALGDCLMDYRAESIAAEMARHHYHLQHLLYQLALHRYLLVNLPGYQFEQHFGGAIYLFLRGFARGPELGYFHHRASLELIAELSEVLGGS